MQGICKATDAIWRAEAAYNCAYDAATKVEQLQRQMEAMHVLLIAIKAEVAPDAKVEASPLRRAI